MANEDEIVVNPPQQLDVQYGDDVETTTVRGEVNGQQDAIVIVNPKTQETYTFNKKEIIEIVLKSPSFAAALAKAISEAPSGSSVEANPTLAGTESALTGLDVDGTKYKVEQPTEVVANPTLAGTEANLEGLQVGNTKYKVGGSGGATWHKYLIYATYKTAFLYDTDTDGITTMADLAADLYAKGYTGGGSDYTKHYPINDPTLQTEGSGDLTNLYIIMSLFSSNGTTTYAKSANLTWSTDHFTFNTGNSINLTDWSIKQVL